MSGSLTDVWVFDVTNSDGHTKGQQADSRWIRYKLDSPIQVEETASCYLVVDISDMEVRYYPNISRWRPIRANLIR